jgi:outer membrane lipoprotein-sorting protein
MFRAGLVASAALIALVLFVPGARGQEDLSAEEIVRRAVEDHQPEGERGVIEMVLVTDDGQKQKRSMEFFFQKGKEDDNKSMLRFLTPSRIRGTALLTLEASGRADDQWVYLPALRKSKKIASSKRTNRFAQTDYTYEDLRTEKYDAYDYAREEETVVDGKACYVVRATPKDPGTSGYSKRVLHIEKERFLSLKTEFYDKRDRHQKTLTSKGFEKSTGYWRPTMVAMEDYLRGTKTLWRFRDRKVVPDISDALFTVRNLERGL